MMDQDLVIAVRRGEVKLAQEGKYHTQDEFDKVSLLFKKGQGITEIALEIQRTELATIQIVEKLDLFERKKKPRRRRKHKPRPPCCATCDRYPNGCKGCAHYIPREENR